MTNNNNNNNALFSVILSSIAPELSEWREDAVSDPLWDGSSTPWLHVDWVGDVLADSSEPMADLWDSLPSREQRSMLSDALDVYTHGMADCLSGATL